MPGGRRSNPARTREAARFAREPRGPRCGGGAIEGVIRPAAPDGEAAVATVPASRWSSPGSRRSSTAPGGRLGERFIAQAPPAVVKRALARAAELEERVAQLRTSLAG
jgi:hypothetical protein